MSTSKLSKFLLLQCHKRVLWSTKTTNESCDCRALQICSESEWFVVFCSLNCLKGSKVGKSLWVTQSWSPEVLRGTGARSVVAESHGKLVQSLDVANVPTRSCTTAEMNLNDNINININVNINISININIHWLTLIACILDLLSPILTDHMATIRYHIVTKHQCYHTWFTRII